MKPHPTIADTHTVLRLLRLLPPRDRLRVVTEILPELAQDLPDTNRCSSFWSGVDIQSLANQQNVQPVTDLSELLGGWPDDEPLDDFLAAVREWRQVNLAEAVTE